MSDAIRPVVNEIAIYWHIEDVMFCNAEEDDQGKSIRRCTEDQAREVLRRIDDGHDASIGINWDVIEAQLEDVLKEAS